MDMRRQSFAAKPGGKVMLGLVERERIHCGFGRRAIRVDIPDPSRTELFWGASQI
jgi:hypothetical protein